VLYKSTIDIDNLTLT